MPITPGTISIRNDLFAAKKECGAADLYVASLIDNKPEWEVLLDNPDKRVLWLKE